MTGIPYGPNGWMFGLREDHERGDLLCLRSPDRVGYWQRGCPTTGLPVAPVWSRAAGEVAVDPMVWARSAVAKAHERVGQLAERGRAQAVGWRPAEDTADQASCERAVGGAA